MYSASRGILYTAPPAPDDETEAEATSEAADSAAGSEASAVTADD